MKISVVAPIFRSGPYLKELHRRLVASIAETDATSYEILFVNDHCPANSLEIATQIVKADDSVVVIDLSRNFGQHKAIMTGIAHSSGDFVFVIDSDLDEEPEWLNLFYGNLILDKCDVIYGVTSINKRSYIYKAFRTIFYRLLNFVSGVSFPANITNARIMTRRYCNALLEFRETEIYLGGLWHITGFAQMPSFVVKHHASPSSYSKRRLFSLVANAVTGFSTRPLIAIAFAGIALSAVAIIYLFWVLYSKFISGDPVEGWASVMSAVLLIGGMSTLFNGVVAIYIAKIFLEVKRRPLTIVREIISSENCNNFPNEELKR